MIFWIFYIHVKKQWEIITQAYPWHFIGFLILAMLIPKSYELSNIYWIGRISMDLVMPVLVGLLFVYCGFFLEKVEPNWFAGIRTPWTLSSPAVWKKTHILGGKLFKLAGIVSCAGSLVTHKPYKIPGQRYQYTRGEVIVGKAIECIYENNVLKPVGKVPFREGERIRVMVEKKLPFEPIQLKKKPSSARIGSLKDESWTSS